MKKVLLSIMLVLSIVSAKAYNTVEGSKLFNNTYLTLGIGADSWMKPADHGYDNMWKGMHPVVTILWGKYFTPVIGAELEGQFAFGTQTGDNTLYNSYAGINSLVNLMNLFGNYKGYPRRAELVMYNGIGWKYNHDNNLDCPENYWGLRHGLQLNFNLGEKRAWQINVRNGVSYFFAGHHTPETCYPARYRATRGMVNFNVGVTYKFQYKNKQGEKTNNFTLADDGIACLHERDSLTARVQELENTKIEPIVKVVEKPVEVIVYKDAPNKGKAEMAKPRFKQNAYELSDASKEEMKNTAEEMKDAKDNYLLTGWASIEGNVDYNKRLSLKRAKTVKNYLVKCGIEANRLETIGGGPTEQFGPNYEDNRIVTIEKK